MAVTHSQDFEFRQYEFEYLATWATLDLVSRPLGSRTHRQIILTVDSG